MAVRLPDALLVAGFGVFVLARRRRFFPVFAATALAAPALVLLYNLRCLGHAAVLGAGMRPASGRYFARPLLDGIAMLIASPGIGLLFFSPFRLLLLFRLPGTDISSDDPALAWCLAVSIAAQVLLYAKFEYRTGGACYGSRYLTDVLRCQPPRSRSRPAPRARATFASISPSVNRTSAAAAPCGCLSSRFPPERARCSCRRSRRFTRSSEVERLTKSR